MLAVRAEAGGPVDGADDGADRVAERLEAEKDEIGGARELERDEDRLGGDEQRRQPMLVATVQHACPEATPSAVATPAAPAAEQGVPDRQCRVLAGRDDHEDRDPEEGSELAHR